MGGVSRRSAGAAILGLAGLIPPAVASAAPAARPVAGPVPASPAPVPPPAIAVLAMLRSTLLAVEHANRTGNYTVLRDLAGPQFREANNAARLAQIFGPISAQGVDLLAVAVTEPVYRPAPTVNAERMLHLRGMFPIRPRTVAFEVLFEPVGPQWRLFAVGLQAI